MLAQAEESTNDTPPTEEARRKVIWFENESQLVGECKIPLTLYREMRRAPLIQLQYPTRYARLRRILAEYGNFNISELEVAITRLSKRLGSKKFNNCVSLLREGKISDVALAMLDYYDKGYERGLKSREEEGKEGGYKVRICNFMLQSEEGIDGQTLGELVKCSRDIFRSGKIKSE